MYSATAFFFLSYIPMLRSEYKNARTSVYARNVPEHICLFSGITLALIYAFRMNNTTLMINYLCSWVIEAGILSAKVWYCVIGPYCFYSQKPETQNDVKVIDIISPLYSDLIVP